MPTKKPLWDQQNLSQDISRLQQQRDLLWRKLGDLQKQLIMETRAEEMFRLEHLIAEVQTEGDQIDQRLRELPNRFVEINSDTGRSAGGNDAQGLDTVFSGTQRINSLSELAELLNVEQFAYFSFEKPEKSKIDFIFSNLKKISEIIQKYNKINNQNNKNEKLLQLMIILRKLKNSPFIQGEWYTENVQKCVEQWLKLVENEVDTQGRPETYREIPNPFIYGKPISPVDSEVFVGRQDIVKIVEQAVIQEPKPTLFLYGRRRTGKTSALLNLNRFIGWLVVAVPIDFQNLRFRESSSAFCRNVSKEISNLIPQLSEKFKQKKFDSNPFTAFHEFLDEAENFITEYDKVILLAFDEYERLDARHQDILDTLRSIIQHRRRIVVLVAGSHRFSEIKGISWSDYLINTQAVEISYLDRESAYKLITNPVEDFDLKYPNNMPEEILELTHCQPYLLQAIVHELVNYLNFQERKEATFDDLKIVKEKVLTAAEAYFTNAWFDECRDNERNFLEDLIITDRNAIKFDPRNSVLRSLLRKEILAKKDGEVQIAVPLFRQWILEKQLMMSRV